jgi:hypothetical protein
LYSVGGAVVDTLDDDLLDGWTDVDLQDDVAATGTSTRTPLNPSVIVFFPTKVSKTSRSCTVWLDVHESK